MAKDLTAMSVATPSSAAETAALPPSRASPPTLVSTPALAPAGPAGPCGPAAPGAPLAPAGPFWFHASAVSPFLQVLAIRSAPFLSTQPLITAGSLEAAIAVPADATITAGSASVRSSFLVIDRK